MKYALAIALLATSTICAAAQETSWDGWFAGFDAGYIWRAPDEAGPMAGLVVGHWWQMGQIALGLDAGGTLGGPYRNTVWSIGLGFGDLKIETFEAATFSVRAKAGMPMGDTLPYLAVGPQFIHVLNTSTSLPSGITSDYWMTRSGWTLAAGAEHRLSESISIKGEAGFNGYWSSRGASHSGWSAKAGLNYHF